MLQGESPLRYHHSSSVGSPRPSLSPEGWARALICGESAASLLLHLLLDDCSAKALRAELWAWPRVMRGPTISQGAQVFQWPHLAAASGHVSDLPQHLPEGLVDRPRLSSRNVIHLHLYSNLLHPSIKFGFFTKPYAFLSNYIGRYILFQLTMASNLKRG